MAAHGTSTGGDTPTETTGISDDIIHRLQDIMVGTGDATTQQGTLLLTSPPTPAAALRAPAPAAANNAVCVASTARTGVVTAPSSSKGAMAAKLDSLRRRRLLLRRRRPASVVSITRGLQSLAVGAAPAAVRPTPRELISSFLLPKIAGQQPLPRAARYIHDADVYAAAPDRLRPILAVNRDDTGACGSFFFQERLPPLVKKGPYFYSYF